MIKLNSQIWIKNKVCKPFWKIMCKTGSILLNLLTSIFSALLVNYIFNSVNFANIEHGMKFLNVMVITSSILIIYNLIGLNIKLMQSERLLEKIEDVNDIPTEKWIFSNSFSDKLIYKIIALFICVISLLLSAFIVPLIYSFI